MPFKVKLTHAPNPDIRTAGYWQPPVDSRRPKQIIVASLEEASTTCRAYIERNGLGGGNWTGGEVRDENDNVIGRISYNGRFQTNEQLAEFDKLLAALRVTA